MTLIARDLRYTEKDFDSLRGRLVQLARSAFPEWNEEIASLGMTFLELFAFVGDVLLHYQDNQARESRLVTATQRQNVIALAKMLGYRLHGAAAATVPVELTLARIPQADVSVPAGTVLRTDDARNPLRFQVLEAVLIRAGQDPPVTMGVAEQSESHEQRLDAVGTPLLEVGLERSPYLDSSLRVRDTGGDWIEVDSLLGSTPADRHFTVSTDSLDHATVRFGDGRNGLPPSGALVMTYKTGGGVRGNVEPGAIRVVEGTVFDAHGQPVQVSVSNPVKASGGVDRESIAHAKRMAPLSLRAPARSVAREDFEIHALKVPGIARALMLTSNEDATLSENAGDVLVVPQGGGPPSQALLDAVLHQVTVVYPSTLTFQVRVVPPLYKPIDIEARLLLGPTAAPADVGRRIRERLATFFAPSLSNGTPNPSVDFGFALREDGADDGRLAWSDIANLVLDTPGVRKLAQGAVDLLLNGAPADVTLGIRAFPVLGQLSLTRADTGASF